METDIVTQVVGAQAYVAIWNPDFLDKELGKDGTCNRFYPDKRVAITIGDPHDQVNRRKRRLLARQGLIHFCIPEGVSSEQLLELYVEALADFQNRQAKRQKYN